MKLARTVSSGAWVAGVSFLDLGVALVTACLVGRHLGASGLGSFSLLMAVCLTINTVVDLGASALLTRDVAGERTQARAKLTDHLRLKLLLLAMVSLVVVAGLVIGRLPWLSEMLQRTPAGSRFLPFPGPLLRVSLAGAPFIVFSSLNITIAATLRGMGRLRPLVGAALVSVCLQTIGVSYGLWSGGGLASVLLIMGAAQGLRSVISGAPFVRASCGSSVPPQRMAALFRSTLPFAGVALIGMAYLKADIYLLSALAGAATTGVYAGALRVTELIKVLPGAFLSMAYPEMVKNERLGASSEASNGSLDDPVEPLGRRLDRLLWLSSSVTAIGLIVGAPWILNGLYGSSLAPAELPLQILAVGLVAAVQNNAQLLRFYAKSQERVVLRAVGAGLLMKAGLNLLLVPLGGATGAAVALSGSDWFLLWLYRSYGRSLSAVGGDVSSLAAAESPS